jgi:hypothetical protein
MGGPISNSAVTKRRQNQGFTMEHASGTPIELFVFGISEYVALPAILASLDLR